MRSQPITAASFWSRVRKTKTCWLWTKGTQGRYGLTTDQGKKKTAHRKAWELAHGPIPDGLHVLHSCDVPLCVRPDHLFLGTHQDNMADMAAKGRGPRGSDHWHTHLTEADVRAIRQFFRERRFTQEALAEMYHTSRSNIAQIVTYRHWAWLPD